MIKLLYFFFIVFYWFFDGLNDDIGLKIIMFKWFLFVDWFDRNIEFGYVKRNVIN